MVCTGRKPEVLEAKSDAPYVGSTAAPRRGVGKAR